MKLKDISRTLKGFVLVFMAAGIMMTASMADTGYAQNPEKLCYSCSNQVYEAIDKQKIKAFTEATGIEVEVDTGSSIWADIQLIMYESSDIASSARSLYKRHQNRGLEEVPFCRDPLVIITRKGCGVDNLTQQQVEEIFSGRISNWKELGGEDLEILVIVPSEDTAANKNFRRQFMKHQDMSYDIMTRSSTMATVAVKSLPCGAVSFIGRGAGVKTPEIKVVKIDGKSPEDPDYPFYQTFYYVTRGLPKGAAKKFIDFTFSEAGRALLIENGLIPVKR